MIEFNSEHVSADLSLIREKAEKMNQMGKVLLCGVTLSGVLLLSGCGQNVNAVTTSVNTSSWQKQSDELVLDEESKMAETYEEITKTAIIFENGNCMIVELQKWEKYYQYFQNYDGVRNGNFEYAIEQQSANDNIYALTATNGDVILAVDNKKTKTWDRAQVLLTLDNKKEYYEIKVRHEDNTEETLKVKPQESVLEDGSKTKVFGVSIASEKSYGLGASIKYAASKFTSIYESMFTIIGGLFTGKLGVNSLSGPVGMYSIVEQSFALGLAQIIYLTAYISINLGFMNLLPFPAFDGGHVVFIIIEKLRGKPIDKNIEGWCHAIGFLILMLLMIFITIKDIVNIF